MKLGMSLSEALKEAMQDLWALDDPYYGSMHIVGLDRNGNPAAASNAAATFIYQRGDMNECAEEPRMLVASDDPEKQGGWSTVAAPAERSDRQ
jgi:hypothetical protein